ncbi:ABC transporter ATP-binding protein [Oscillospiraceae bacterium HV4-5-C5C]|nr:ABC transporter ATP-binding protein [Oscillospiraceae bacterium HV4-5-C5C]
MSNHEDRPAKAEAAASGAATPGERRDGYRSGPAIAGQGLTKRFGSVLANDHIDFEVEYGEILALLGENGSGKTTLMNLLSGLYFPDSGQIYVDGQAVSVSTPADAISLGIGMIHQHFKLVEAMTALENILLGPRTSKFSLARHRQEIERMCKTYGLTVDLGKPVYDMSVSEKQTVEVVKVLYHGARILILDEPTAVLTPQETESLFAILRRMKQQGCAIIIITHKLNEVLAISDRVMVLRRGRSEALLQTSQADLRSLTETMVGHAIDLKINRPTYAAERQKTLLAVQELSVIRPDGSQALDQVSFELKTGEILGVAGVAGSGQKELSEALVSLTPCQSGSITYCGQVISGLPTTEIYKKGVSLAFVPEDRLGMGLVGDMGMPGNMLLKSYRDHRGFFIDCKPAEQLSQQLKETLDISTPSLETPVRLLSGGNVQKVLLGREIESQPQVLITSYPVRGLDINASYTVYDLLNEQKMKGCGILYLGEDLDVLLELADRILVLCHGRVTGIVDARQASKETVGLMMAGMTLKEELA